MAERRVSVRLSAVDGDKFKADLAAIGSDGQRSLQLIAGGAAPASAGLAKVEGATSAALRQLEALADRAGRAAAGLRAAGASTGTLVERIDQITGVSGRIQRSATDITDYGSALDDLRAKHNPLFAVIRDYRTQLSEIRQAHRVGAISADEMAAAISHERRAALESIAAIKGRTAAIQQMDTVTRAASYQTRNLQFQLIDIAQGIPLAFQSPLYALQNFAFQGAQIAQIYGPEEGGVGRAIREAGSMVGRFVARLAPVAVVAAAVAAAIGGMTYEINQTTDATVTFGDTALAVWQVIRDGLYSILKPAIDAVAPWFQIAWDLIIAGVKWVGNLIINSFRAAFEDIKSVWNSLPDILEGAVIGAVNAVIRGVNDMVQKAAAGIDWLIEKINQIPGIDIAPIGALKPLEELANPAADRALAALEERNRRIAEIMSSDPLEEFFSEVRQRAIANSIKRTKEETDKAADSMRQLRSEGEQVYHSVRTAAEEYADTVANLNRLFDAGAISFEIYSRAIKQAQDRFEEMAKTERRRQLRESGDLFGGAIAFLDEYAEKAGTTSKLIEESFSKAFSGAEDAVAQFVQQGKVDFHSLISSMLADLARLSIRQAVLGPLAGWLGGLLGSGSVDPWAGLRTVTLHGGGIAGRDGAARTVPALAFAAAPRLHDGSGMLGLRPDEMPAILQRGERVLNRREAREWERGRGVTINISTPDVEGFRRARTQIAADLARAVAYGSRGL